MLCAMLVDTYCDQLPVIRIAYAMDGQLLSQRRMHFHSRVSKATIHELLFTDDCALNAATEGDMQRSIDLVAATCFNFGLRINTEKTVVIHQPPPNTTYNRARINLADAAVWSGGLDDLPEASAEAQPLPSQLFPLNNKAERARQDLDTEVMERTGLSSIYAQLKQLQLRWTGHLVITEYKNDSSTEMAPRVLLGKRVEALTTLGVHQHSTEQETEEGGSQYAALLHSVGHFECFGDSPVVSDARHHPVVKLTHHVVNAPVAASNWYPTLTCGSSKLGSSQRPHPGQPSRPAG
ncbi:unnamed protein product [Schistocephalus solidus]|uniref:Reverse transcriptase domain-containing protein n=1 Tax=Schistocephalus solidus TaxID=70667 RepID=A0A183S7L0_SCHSO|nr:unnamed protein product [Schistocephalus solidus]